MKAVVHAPSITRNCYTNNLPGKLPRKLIDLHVESPDFLLHGCDGNALRESAPTDRETTTPAAQKWMGMTGIGLQGRKEGRASVPNPTSHLPNSGPLYLDNISENHPFIFISATHL